MKQTTLINRPAKKSSLAPEQIQKLLKEAGVQPTAQRLAIAQYVLCEADHPTAEDVKLWADKHFPKMSLATVYNTLKIFVQAGLLIEFRMPHSEKIIFDNNQEPHIHFMDEATEKLFDLSWDQVSFKLDIKKLDLDVRQVDVFIRGRRKNN